MARKILGTVCGCVLLLANGACKPMHDRSGLDPVSNPERAVSDSGTVLTAMAGKGGGICFLRSSLRDDAAPELVTKQGAFSSKQLEKLLSFMSYPEHFLSIIAGAVGTAAGVGTAVASGLKRLDGGSIKASVKAGAPVGVVVGGAVAITSLVGGTFGYRIIKGNIEGEKAGPIAVHSVMSSIAPATLITTPVTEYFTRQGRLHKVLSDKEEQQFTDKRMRKLIAKLLSTVPRYPGGCDHIKEGMHQQ